jgi:hypothetical protein
MCHLSIPIRYNIIFHPTYLREQIGKGKYSLVPYIESVSSEPRDNETSVTVLSKDNKNSRAKI